MREEVNLKKTDEVEVDSESNNLKSDEEIMGMIFTSNEYNSLNIYTSPNSSAEIMTEIKDGKALQNIENTFIYEVIDDNLAAWFKLKVGEGKQGYLYKELKSGEIHRSFEKRQNITLLLDNGGKVVFDSKKDECDYYLEDYYSRIGYYSVVQTWGGEGYGHILVNKSNGKKTSMYGRPIFSTDYKKMLVASFDLEACFDWNGIQIFKYEDGEIVLEWEKELGDWGPSNAKWIDNETISLIKNSQVENGYEKTPIKLIFKDNNWIIKE